MVKNQLHAHQVEVFPRKGLVGWGALVEEISEQNTGYLTANCVLKLLI